eukprot:scaffold25402_cov44-Phaeocystis_antarctica.AAC.3
MPGCEGVRQRARWKRDYPGGVTVAAVAHGCARVQSNTYTQGERVITVSVPRYVVAFNTPTSGARRREPERTHGRRPAARAAMGGDSDSDSDSSLIGTCATHQPEPCCPTSLCASPGGAPPVRTQAHFGR